MTIKTQAPLRGSEKVERTVSHASRRGQGQLWMLISIVLLVVGVGVTVYGISIGLRALNGLYAGAMNDALGQPDGTEEQVSKDMLTGVFTGMAGVVPLICGTVMFRIAKIRRKRHKQSANIEQKWI